MDIEVKVGFMVWFWFILLKNPGMLDLKLGMRKSKDIRVSFELGI